MLFILCNSAQGLEIFCNFIAMNLPGTPETFLSKKPDRGEADNIRTVISLPSYRSGLPSLNQRERPDKDS